MNVNAVEYLLAACETHNTHLIHLSTDFVFDGEDGPYSEVDIPKPLTYYGESKYASEMLLRNSEYKNWAIARTIIVYGVVEKMSRSNIVLWAKGALEKGDPINVVDDQFRSPTLAIDLAKGCVLIADKQAKDFDKTFFILHKFFSLIPPRGISSVFDRIYILLNLCTPK